MTVSETDEHIRCFEDQAAGMIELDRPRALNALTDAMRQSIVAALPDWEQNPMIYGVVSRSAHARAFCAGGDVRELLQLVKRDLGEARASLRAEYTLNWQIDTFTKPHVALIDGMVFGSGVGLTSFTTHQVAGDGYLFSMPECAIGFFPDVGGMHVLAGLPGRIGLYLALTGARVGPDDAFALGLVTHRIDASGFSAITAGMAGADPIDPILDGANAPGSDTPIMDARDAINHAFSGETVDDILVAVEAEDADWARDAAAALRAQSPLSQAVTFEHYRRARTLDLRQVLINDYRIGSRLMAEPDMAEGIRALLIDKDQSPKWTHGKAGDVGPDVIASFFEPAPDGDLDLEERVFEPSV